MSLQKSVQIEGHNRICSATVFTGPWLLVCLLFCYSVRYAFICLFVLCAIPTFWCIYHQFVHLWEFPYFPCKTSSLKGSRRGLGEWQDVRRTHLWKWGALKRDWLNLGLRLLRRRRRRGSGCCKRATVLVRLTWRVKRYKSRSLP